MKQKIKEKSKKRPLNHITKKSRNKKPSTRELKNRYMTNQNYWDLTAKQSQEKFSRMKEKMLEPIKQVQQARQESLRNLLTEIEKKQSILQDKRVNLEKLCQG